MPAVPAAGPVSIVPRCPMNADLPIRDGMRVATSICCCARGLRRFAVRRITRQLDLDAAQRAKVQAILRDARERILGLAEKNRPETDEILGQARERIRAELRPEQRERFDRIVEERQERRRFRLGEHAPGQSR